MQGICNYTSEARHVSGVYTSAAILFLNFGTRALFLMLNVLYFYIIVVIIIIIIIII
jgi:hypothetical protein